MSVSEGGVKSPWRPRSRPVCNPDKLLLDPYARALEGSNPAYCVLDPNRPSAYIDTTGVGNSLNAGHPTALRLIMDSLRHWVVEMHVDDPAAVVDAGAMVSLAPRSLQVLLGTR